MHALERYTISSGVPFCFPNNGVHLPLWSLFPKYTLSTAFLNVTGNRVSVYENSNPRLFGSSGHRSLKMVFGTSLPEFNPEKVNLFSNYFAPALSGYYKIV